MDVATVSNLFFNKAPVFTGNTLSKDVDTWVTEIKKWEKDLLNQVANHVAATMVITKLEGPAANAIALRLFENPKEVFIFLKGKYPAYQYQAELHNQLAKGECFNSMEAIDCAEEATRINNVLGNTNLSANTIAISVSKRFPHIWVYTGISAFNVKKDNFESTLKTFRVYAEIAPPIATTTHRWEDIEKAPSCQTLIAQRSETHVAQAHPTKPIHRQRHKENRGCYSELERQIKALTLQLNKLSAGKE
ncbi:hypothetical protein BDF14DRAFT_1887342 [Spinellus fusiger]|nr:hypothetical protein BDF14DRAFT_1887342 [Spinellus fusiger]